MKHIADKPYILSPPKSPPLKTDSGFQVLLFQPEIPPNTGNILRLCAAVATCVHLIGPLGFHMDAASLRRAGMDYPDWSQIFRHADWENYQAVQPVNHRLFAISTHGKVNYTELQFQPGDRFLFGSESAGLPISVRQTLQAPLLRIPMVGNARSLNLANSVAIVLFEALRQTGFTGLS
ncbi:MAG: tRNA (cytidine(34)-2'-O)-methyltransferase [Magnetococcus sp. DMHC-6]